MEWIQLDTAGQIDAIKQHAGYSLIFKHSTRCSISMMAKRRFELDWENLPADMPLYFLDLIKHRELSNKVAQDFSVYHESPLDQSHGAISVDETMSVLS
jgi:bacillithiol system protein YtxJ